MTTERRWVNWRLEERNGKKTKLPYQPNGKLAKSSDESTWSTFEEVTLANGHVWSGVGFCLMGSEIAAFDIDKCRDRETGEVAPWAVALVERAGSYAEITPSLTGLRILGYGRGAEVHRKLPVGDGVSCEIYRQATRYITVSGNVFCDKPLVNIDA
jgi:primase-polymerase (primpol)-like protein